MCSSVEIYLLHGNFSAVAHELPEGWPGTCLSYWLKEVRKRKKKELLRLSISAAVWNSFLEEVTDLLCCVAIPVV